MSANSILDIAIVGGGIVGLSTARTLAERYSGLGIAVFEKELDVAQHQTGHNSGVIHSGIYYRPGSLRARMAVEGSKRMMSFCAEHGIPFDRCGKVIVATAKSQIPALEELARRGDANGVPDVRMIGPDELAELEPHATGIQALHVPSAGIVNYSLVAQMYRKLFEQAGGQVRTGGEVFAIVEEPNALRLETAHGDVRSRHVIACGGLFADRVSISAGLKPPLKTAPFRGEYYELVPDSRYLVRNLIYPVSNPAFPFLGVHFTRRINGAIEVGPNAVFALKRQGLSLARRQYPRHARHLGLRGFLAHGGALLAHRHWGNVPFAAQRCHGEGVAEARARRHGPRLGAGGSGRTRAGARPAREAYRRLPHCAATAYDPRPQCALSGSDSLASHWRVCGGHGGGVAGAKHMNYRSCR